jgi:hypothetical protein
VQNGGLWGAGRNSTFITNNLKELFSTTIRNNILPIVAPRGTPEDSAGVQHVLGIFRCGGGGRMGDCGGRGGIGTSLLSLKKCCSWQPRGITYYPSRPPRGTPEDSAGAEPAECEAKFTADTPEDSAGAEPAECEAKFTADTHEGWRHCGHARGPAAPCGPASSRAGHEAGVPADTPEGPPIPADQRRAARARG